MSEDFVKWLAEIRTLKQQLTESEKERDEAIVREENWRKLYATEAQQRRSEVQLAREEIESIKAQLSQQGFNLTTTVDTNEAQGDLAEEIAQFTTVEALQGKLMAVTQERDRALNALQIEQENHAQTRKSLTAVISDTIDQIQK